MEIGQNIKEFTEQGEVVLIYSLSSDSVVLQLTNVGPRIVSCTLSGREVIAGYQQFMDSRVDPCAKIWQSSAEQDAVVFSSQVDGKPVQVVFTLVDGGFRVDVAYALGVNYELEPFFFCADESAVVSSGEQNNRVALGDSCVVEVQGWQQDSVCEVASVEAEELSVKLLSSMPKVCVSRSGKGVLLMPADEALRYQSSGEQLPEGAVEAIEHSAIYLLK